MIPLPDSIRACIGDSEPIRDTVGKSGAGVLLLPDRVLKIQTADENARREIAMLEWLQGKLPVPQILAHVEEQGQSWLLMSRIPGEMACSERWMKDPNGQISLLAQTLELLWQVDVSGCPSDQRLAEKLKSAEYNVCHGLVDIEDTQPDTFGPRGFRDPEALLYWLRQNQPEEQPVLSHGDFCLPNILFRSGALSGLIDLSRCGIGDKWNDIALCLRSLTDNYAGHYGRAYPGFSEELLFDGLGIVPDRDQIRYYILLDELF